MTLMHKNWARLISICNPTSIIQRKNNGRCKIAMIIVVDFVPLIARIT